MSTDNTLPAPMIYPAVIAIMNEVGPIGKDSKNQSQGYNFRGVDAIYNAVHPLFCKHGVFSTSKVMDSRHEFLADKNGKPYHLAIIGMQFTFYAADGSSVITEVVGEGQDYGGDKASNKAMSVADKYAILQLLKIPTMMVDPDRTEHDNPDARPDAPQVPPRGQRPPATPPVASEISEAQLKAVFEEYANVNDLPLDTPDSKTASWRKFVTWAGSTVEGDWNPSKRAEWTKVRYDACMAKLGIGGEGE